MPGPRLPQQGGQAAAGLAAPQPPADVTNKLLEGLQTTFEKLCATMDAKKNDREERYILNGERSLQSRLANLLLRDEDPKLLDHNRSFELAISYEEVGRDRFRPMDKLQAYGQTLQEGSTRRNVFDTAYK